MEKRKNFMVIVRTAVILAFIFGAICQNNSTSAQTYNVTTKNFREVVVKRLSGLKKISTVRGQKLESDLTLEDVCPIDTDSVAKRVFTEYGAIFISADSVQFPTQCIFENEKDVQVYQNSADSKTAAVGGTLIILQKSAMDALLEAVKDAADKNLRITPRGGSIAAKRTYQDTVRLWNSRFYPALEYWVKKGKITRGEAEAAKKMPIHKQIAEVLQWEAKGFYFSKDLSKSILFSVAAPGASQHIFMLALDVEQFDDLKVRDILAAHGWFQTVKSDFPHFTFLGVQEKDLTRLGLKPFLINGHKFWLTDL